MFHDGRILGAKRSAISMKRLAIKPERLRAPREAFERSRDEGKKVEMRFAHLKTHHGFERMRLRGLYGARELKLFSAPCRLFPRRRT